jgi:hypothetical protein
MHKTSKNHEKKMFRIYDKAKTKYTYKRLKLCGGHVYDRSSVQTAMAVYILTND